MVLYTKMGKKQSGFRGGESALAILNFICQMDIQKKP
jgi:hypothetical protein